MSVAALHAPTTRSKCEGTRDRKADSAVEAVSRQGDVMRDSARDSSTEQRFQSAAETLVEMSMASICSRLMFPSESPSSGGGAHVLADANKGLYTAASTPHHATGELIICECELIGCRDAVQLASEVFPHDFPISI
jgi:hypothetical protein